MVGEPFRGEADWPGRDLLIDLAACLRFYSRLKLPPFPGEPDPHAVPDFRTIPRMLPVAGLILALPPALVLRQLQRPTLRRSPGLLLSSS